MYQDSPRRTRANERRIGIETGDELREIAELDANGEPWSCQGYGGSRGMFR